MSIRPATQYIDRPAAEISPLANPPAADLQSGDAARIRYETFSPVEEYAVREGQTEPLDEEFHAVLSNDYRGSGTVTANGILIKSADLVGAANVREGVIFWHPDSDLCNRVASGPVQVNYTYNPARPQVVHLWSLEWRYLETLPAKAKAPILDNAALKELAKHTRRQIQRFADHAQQLHQGDTARALAELSHNASAMDRVAVSLPLPTDSQPAPRPATRETEAVAFDAARRDTSVVMDQASQTRRLIDEADADIVALQSHRRTSSPVLAHDPLDDY